MSKVVIDPEKLTVFIELDYRLEYEKKVIDFQFREAKKGLIKFLKKTGVKVV